MLFKRNANHVYFSFNKKCLNKVKISIAMCSPPVSMKQDNNHWKKMKSNTNRIARQWTPTEQMLSSVRNKLQAIYIYTYKYNLQHPDHTQTHTHTHTHTHTMLPHCNQFIRSWSSFSNPVSHGQQQCKTLHTGVRRCSDAFA